MNIDYRKLMIVLARGNKEQFDIPKSAQIKFLEAHVNPKNDIHRSFYQYKAQMLFISTAKRLAFNFVGLCAIIPLLLIAFLKRISYKFQYKVDAIIEKNSHSGVIPDSLSQKYVISQREWNIGWSLGIKDLPFIIRLLMYIFRSPYFVFKISYKTALYSSMIKSFEPNAIIVFNEYSFTSSALTYFCEEQNVKHIDVMHGEKLFYIRDSYFRFSETYVWEPYYIKLLTELQAPEEQFITELPPFMRIQPSQYFDKNYNPDYTYYLACYNEQQIKNIVTSMQFAKSQGKTIMYRPHPRYSDINLLRNYVKEENIEYPHEMNIMVSVANTRCAVGVYTTVLNQAYHAGKRVIIDDLNFPNDYGKLQELGYSLFSKSIMHLSDLQK